MRKFLAILLVVASCNAADAGPIRNFFAKFRPQRPVVQRPIVQRPVVKQQAAPTVVCVDGKCYKK